MYLKAKIIDSESVDFLSDCHVLQFLSRAEGINSSDGELIDIKSIVEAVIVEKGNIRTINIKNLFLYNPEGVMGK
jgi:hypothetical protein